MTNHKNKMRKVVNVKVNPESYSKLKHIAFDKLVSVTSIVESLIENYIKENEAKSHEAQNDL